MNNRKTNLPKKMKIQKNIDDYIKEFHKNISTGPTYICSVCHQTWFEQSVKYLLDIIHVIPEKVKKHITDLKSIQKVGLPLLLVFILGSCATMAGVLVGSTLITQDYFGGNKTIYFLKAVVSQMCGKFSE